MDEESFHRAFLDRTLPFLTESGAELLKEKTVAIAGCGGVGGLAAVSLARMGIGGFHLADPGRFDEPDINRQMGATTSSLGKRKTDVYRDVILDINPFARVEVWEEGVTPGNVGGFVAGADLLIDCLDLSVPPRLRGELFARARADGLYALTAPVLGFGAIVVCSDPEGMSMEPFVRLLESSQAAASFPKLLYRVFMPEHLDRIAEWLDEKKVKVPSVAVSPLLAAGVVVTESVNALAGHFIAGGRRPLSLPQFLLLDLFSLNLVVANAEVLK